MRATVVVCAGQLTGLWNPHVSAVALDPFHVYVSDTSAETSTLPFNTMGIPVLNVVFAPILMPSVSDQPCVSVRVFEKLRVRVWATLVELSRVTVSNCSGAEDSRLAWLTS